MELTQHQIFADLGEDLTAEQFVKEITHRLDKWMGEFSKRIIFKFPAEPGWVVAFLEQKDGVVSVNLGDIITWGLLAPMPQYVPDVPMFSSIPITENGPVNLARVLDIYPPGTGSTEELLNMAEATHNHNMKTVGAAFESSEKLSKTKNEYQKKMTDLLSDLKKYNRR